jgi:hypothetical protein
MWQALTYLFYKYSISNKKNYLFQKLIFILQGIRLLLNKVSSTIISLGYFSLSYVENGEKNIRLLFYLFLLF